MTDTTTSGDAQAATSGDTPAQAATITTSEPQAGDDQYISLEKARELRQEANALRKREKDALAQLKVYQDAEQASKDAQLSEVERISKQYAELQEQHEALAAELYQARVFQEVSRLASKFNFMITADTLARMLLLDDDAIEFEDGKPTNIEKLLEQLAKKEPDLVRQAEQQQQRAPAIPGMNPGRNTITQPGQRTPGRIPRLDDPNLWSR